MTAPERAALAERLEQIAGEYDAKQTEMARTAPLASVAYIYRAGWCREAAAALDRLEAIASAAREYVALRADTAARVDGRLAAAHERLCAAVNEKGAQDAPPL